MANAALDNQKKIFQLLKPGGHITFSFHFFMTVDHFKAQKDRQLKTPHLLEEMESSQKIPNKP